MCTLELLQPADLAWRRHVDRGSALPPQPPLAHRLPPPREHERVNVERGGNRLDLHPTLPTQPHGGELELRTVFLNLLRTCAWHRHLPLLGGSVYKSEGGFPVSFRRLLGGTVTLGEGATATDHQPATCAQRDQESHLADDAPTASPDSGWCLHCHQPLLLPRGR